MLVTLTTYRTITGDTSSSESAVAEAVARAEEELAEALDRPLDEGLRTERMDPTRDGWLWPRATPITEVTDPAGWTINGIGLEPGGYGGWPCRTSVDVTYMGGWVERTANPAATNRLPICIEEDLAWRARAILQGADADGIDPADIPAGATSVRLGDASVTFGPAGAPGSAAGYERAGRRWSRRTLSYRYRVTRSA